MKRKIISFLIIVLSIFVFVIFYKSLNKSNFYEPKSEIKNIPHFLAASISLNEEIDSKTIFNENKYYLLNIWASWCVPCRDEHYFLISLSEDDQLEIIGLNYKDKLRNAKKFLDELGNPYKQNLLDPTGTIAINWGAFGVPETFLIYHDKIIKKFIGPINENSYLEIKRLIK